MNCPTHEIKMESDKKGRLTCPVPECGYNEPLGRDVVTGDGVAVIADHGDDDQEYDEIDDSV